MTTDQVPADLAAEEAAIAAAMTNRTALATVLTMLTPADYYRPAHAVLHQAMSDLAAAGTEVDALTLVRQLRSMEVADPGGGRRKVPALDLVGGPAHVVTMGDRGLAANAAAYCETVRDMATKRAVMGAGHEIVRIAGDDTLPASGVLTAAERALYDAAARTTPEWMGAGAGPAAVDRYVVEYAQRHDGDGHPGWCIPMLWDRIGFLRPGQVVVGAAKTGVGKSWLFHLDWLETLCEQGASVLHCSTEMSEPELLDRLVAMGGYDYEKVELGVVHPSTIKERLRQVAGWKRTAMVGTITADAIRSQVARARLSGDPYDVVIVDYLQDMDFGGRVDDYRISMEQALKQLKLMALDQNVLVILVSQLSRIKPRKTSDDKIVENPPPTLNDLRDTGKIEQVANHVLFLHREWQGNRMLRRGSIIVAKGRSREAVGALEVVWQGSPSYTDPYRFRPPGTSVSEQPARLPDATDEVI